MKVTEKKSIKIKAPLVVYDGLVVLLAAIIVIGLPFIHQEYKLQLMLQLGKYGVCLLIIRYLVGIYRQVWRYGGIYSHIRLIVFDTIFCIMAIIFHSFTQLDDNLYEMILAFAALNTIGASLIRMLYSFAYRNYRLGGKLGNLLSLFLSVCARDVIDSEEKLQKDKIKVALIGAGSVAFGLLENIGNLSMKQYEPCYLVDSDPKKVGKMILGFKVLKECDETIQRLKDEGIHVVIITLSEIDSFSKFSLYEYYRNAGFEVKVYDYSAFQIPERKRRIREFEIEDLLNRKAFEVLDEETVSYYRGKKIMVTGGGGSIGSEICRQLAKMSPKQIVVVDIYENCAYDLQQGLLFAYKKKVDIQVEICSVTNKRGMEKIFEAYQPDILIHAAAHKHVPLMEKNCVEAVANNVFGTKCILDLCTQYGVGRFMLVSTDKAVNPTNVMGATKRVCEMIMQAYSTKGTIICSATRFGNVLGSAGSVIPLFKRQIQSGGPVTVTDKRIIRYFMTIPEASQLVLESGALAKNGEIFVLDMGEPVKIWNLAENMIYLSGMEGIEIIETGLRPGEKLYEELLVKKEELVKTENNLIFIEREEPIHMMELEEKLNLLREACHSLDDEKVRNALKSVVSSYKSPEEVNKN